MISRRRFLEVGGMAAGIAAASHSPASAARSKSDGAPQPPPPAAPGGNAAPADNAQPQLPTMAILSILKICTRQ